MDELDLKSEEIKMGRHKTAERQQTKTENGLNGEY